MGLFDIFKSKKKTGITVEDVYDMRYSGNSLKFLDILKNSDDADVRIAALEYGPRSLSNLMYAVNNDESDFVRLYAINALKGYSGTKFELEELKPLVVTAINHPNPRISEEIIDFFKKCDKKNNKSYDNLIKQIKDGRDAYKARAKITGQIKTEDDILDECVEELLAIYTLNPDGFLSSSPEAKPVRDIARKLNDARGMDLMLRAHEIFSKRISGIGLARNLEMVWDGIGNWRG